MSNIESQFSVTTTNQMKIPSVFDGDIPFISLRTENGVTVGNYWARMEFCPLRATVMKVRNFSLITSLN